MSNTTPLNVIIIGGGIGGLSLARACLDAGLAVELYEKRPLKAMLSGAGGIFIQRNAMRVYDLLWDGRIRDRLYETGGKILSGGFINSQGSPLYINSPSFVGAEDLGVCILRPELQQILLEALPEGTVRPEHAFTQFDDEGDRLRVMFNNGHVAEGDILVGADGLYSTVRAQLGDLDRPEDPEYSGMCCWRGFFNGDGVPFDSRYSWAEMWGQGDRFGYFDVGGGRYSFYAFYNMHPGGNDDALGGSLVVLKSLFADYAEPVPSILKALENQRIYRDDISDRLPLGDRWGNGHVTLLGDVAHPVLPNIGQGGCIAIEDGFELAKQLSKIGERERLPATLRQFEASRSERVAKVFKSSRQVGQLGQVSSKAGCLARNWMYKLMPTWLADRQFQWLFDYQPSWEASQV
ncbi:MAG: FAD-dependent monooxygenase [Cyanobacteria bacterium J06597_1]